MTRMNKNKQYKLLAKHKYKWYWKSVYRMHIRFMELEKEVDDYYNRKEII